MPSEVAHLSLRRHHVPLSQKSIELLEGTPRTSESDVAVGAHQISGHIPHAKAPKGVAVLVAQRSVSASGTEAVDRHNLAVPPPQVV
jgi:hypothetical protein